MGRMKEVCMEIIEANGGIPEGMTIADVARMKELEIYEWKEYEKRQNNLRALQYQSENSEEIGKIDQVQKKFSSKYGEAREEKGSE